MRFRLVRQGALASNVANVDTPQYRRVDVTFDAALDAAAKASGDQTAPGQMRATNARHFGTELEDRFQFERGPRGARPDGNGIDRDQEVIELVRNAGAFQDAANVLSRIYAMRRMAATGQLS
jgi:flagellar basal-body rod protein FlgB